MKYWFLLFCNRIKGGIFAVIYQLYKHSPYHLVTFAFRHIDYFHYKLLSFYEHPFQTKSKLSGIMGNECYGNLWAIRKATRENFHSHCMIEHGLYFGENVNREECTIDCIDTIYTYSEYRKNAILKEFSGKLNKEIVLVGPYIMYVNNFKSNRALRKLKNKLGRVLLVFPSHSTPGFYTDYNENEFLSEIAEVAKNYDSVLVSLFWADVNVGRDKMYLEKGYQVVCSGTRSDRWFLSRQRDLFELADFSMSNDVGTHIGYSISMGVPHYIYNQKVVEGEAKIDYSEMNPIIEKEFKEIKSAFNSRKPVITEEQKKIVDYYWGLSSVITENCRYRNSL